MAYSEYPKAMSHPQSRPAVLSQDTIGPGGKVIHAAPGQPAKFPPVYVNNLDQEQYYSSIGYVPNGTSDPDAYHVAVSGAGKPSAHEHVEFPKYVYQCVDGDVIDRLLKNQDEQDQLEGAWYATPGDARDGAETEVEGASGEEQTPQSGGRRRR